MTLQFKNRYEAVNYYKKEWNKVDQDLQDFLVHNQKVVSEKVNLATKRLKDLQDLIDWNKSEIRRESDDFKNVRLDGDDGVYD